MKPIRVLGGGLAGQVCALLLAQKGYSVTLFEPQTEPQDKVCGEGILPIGVGVLTRLDPKRSWLPLGRAFSGITYQAGSKRAQAGFSGGEFGFGVSRLRLDAWLREQVAQQPKITLNAKRVELHDVLTDDIWACGLQSRLLRVGQPRRARRFGLRFRVLTDEVPRRVTVQFFAWGECYFTPIDDRTVSVAFLVHSNASKPKDFESHIRQMLGPNCQIEKGEARAPIAMAWYKRPNRVLLGDCYRAFDPISGAGMSFALLCAELAAQSAGQLEAYQQAIVPVERHFRRMTNLLLLLSGRPRLAQWVVGKMDRHPQAFASLLHAYNDVSGLGLSAGVQLARLLT